MKLTLQGLELRPAQVWGSIRLVPIVRPKPLVDLRLAIRSYDAYTAVGLSNHTSYLAYIPHGLVMRWSTDGTEAEVPTTTRIGSRELRKDGCLLAIRHMARREARDQLRMLPLHTALEGFLAQHFGGADVVQRYYSKQFKRNGMSPRTERIHFGSQIVGLDEALRVFEIHEGQCGVMIFVADALASVTLVSHPDDYLTMHQSLINDFYGNLIARWGWSFRHVQQHTVSLQGDTLAAIEASLQAQQAEWARFTTLMAGGLFGREVSTQKVRKAGRYQLARFVTGDLDVMIDGEHLGEAMIAPDGELAYLKTYRMDRGQVRRARLLRDLHASDWDLQVLADARGHGRRSHIENDFDQAGLGWMLNPELREGRGGNR